MISTCSCLMSTRVCCFLGGCNPPPSAFSVITGLRRTHGNLEQREETERARIERDAADALLRAVYQLAIGASANLVCVPLPAPSALCAPLPGRPTEPHHTQGALRKSPLSRALAREYTRLWDKTRVEWQVVLALRDQPEERREQARQTLRLMEAAYDCCLRVPMRCRCGGGTPGARRGWEVRRLAPRKSMVMALYMMGEPDAAPGPRRSACLSRSPASLSALSDAMVVGAEVLDKQEYQRFEAEMQELAGQLCVPP